MALDADDIRKLDEHIVEPLLQAVEALGDRIEQSNAQTRESNATLVAEIQTATAEMRESHEDLVEQLVRSNAELRESSSRTLERVVQLNVEILELNRRTLAAHQQGDTSIDHRVSALEEWRAELEKKNSKN